MKKVHVYSHTHWDYEWYFTANETIIQLIYHMDEVIRALENGDLKTYLLDGQVSILEDYLQYVPENTKKVQSLIQQKKLLVGPWYTQSDELIVSGESIVRNLYYGIKQAKEWGYCFPVGYLPDSFGQNQDMPKIYNGFHLHYALFWRGVNPEKVKKREFYWQCQDGSQVLVAHIKNGYYYGGNLIYNDDVGSVEKTILDGAVHDMLLPLGGDQRYVDFNLKERIEKYNQETQHQFLYEESDCVTYLQNIDGSDLEKVQGEFIDATVSKIHHSIYSSRYDHKYLNDKVERRMIYQLEPLMFIAQTLKVTPKNNMMEKIWKKLLMNHAHDSACGCNSDKTNRSIMQRLIDVDQLSYSAMDYLLRKISESLQDVQTNDLIVFNTLPYTRKEPFKVKISTRKAFFDIYQDEQKIVFDVIAQEKHNSGSIKRTLSEMDPQLDYYESTIYLQVPLSPFSITRLHVVETEKNKEEVQTQMYIEDDDYYLACDQGQLVLTDKKHQQVIKDWLSIEDGSDDGDTYDYSPLPKDFICRCDFQKAHLSTQIGALHQTMILEGQWVLPSDLSERQNHQCQKEIPYQLRISLMNSGRVDCHLKIQNTAKDHRMRVIMKTPIKSSYSIADTLFDTVQRDNTPAHLHDWRELQWKEEPTPLYPMIHHVTIKDEVFSANVLVKGIKEYEILNDQDIALTLWRSVGWLGKPDLLRRPGIASGNEFKYIPTPDSQLLQTMTFKFSYSLSQDYDEVQVRRQWENMAISPLYYQIQELNRFVNTQKYFVTHPLPYSIKEVSDLINADQCQKLIISSIGSVDHKSYFIRAYNPYSYQIQEDIKVIGQKAYQTALDFTPMEECPIQDQHLKLGIFQPKQIKTFHIFL